MATIKTILHITPFFSPNIGGVETHLSDLTSSLASLNYQNIILTYSPITTPHTPYQQHQTHKNISINRFPWIGFNLFQKLEKFPLINFLYLTPYLLLRSFFYLLTTKPRIDIIHSHGINAALIGIIIKNILGYHKHIVSIYSSYDNVPLNSVSTKILVTILNNCDVVLTQSDRSISQLKNLGVRPNLLHRYVHWIDTSRFVPSDDFVSDSILFVGRLNPSKNSVTLAKTAKYFPKYIFNFIGTGPDFNKLHKLSKLHKNIHLLGNIPYNDLHRYYANNKILCIPSLYDEGWGRVIMESVSCGTPVIASHFGAIPEVVDNSVSILINPTIKNIRQAINLLSNRSTYTKLKNNCRPYAEKHFSKRNIKYITKHY